MYLQSVSANSSVPVPFMLRCKETALPLKDYCPYSALEILILHHFL